MRRVGLLILGILCITEFGFSQSGADYFYANGSKRIVATSFDYGLLEGLLFREINKVRKARGLVVLKGDLACAEASQNQAKYIVRSGRYGHYQHNSGMRNPEDRVASFGGHYNFVAENANEIMLNEPFRFAFEPQSAEPHEVFTYYQAARMLVYGWMGSKGHRANILDPDFRFTGLGVAYSPQKRRIYAVQIFASDQNRRIASN